MGRTGRSPNMYRYTCIHADLCSHPTFKPTRLVQTRRPPAPPARPDRDHRLAQRMCHWAESGGAAESCSSYAECGTVEKLGMKKAPGRHVFWDRFLESVTCGSATGQAQLFGRSKNHLLYMFLIFSPVCVCFVPVHLS